MKGLVEPPGQGFSFSTQVGSTASIKISCNFLFFFFFNSNHFLHDLFEKCYLLKKKCGIIETVKYKFLAKMLILHF